MTPTYPDLQAEISKTQPPVFKQWLAHHKLTPEAIQPDNRANIVDALRKSQQTLVHTLIKSEPGYPPQLRHTYKAQYVKGLIVDKMMETDTQPVSDNKPQVFIGFAGLDVEIWILHQKHIRYVSFKRYGAKELNSALSHDASDQVRNNLLLHLDNHHDVLVELAQEYFEDGTKLTEEIARKCYGSHIKNEKELFADKLAGGHKMPFGVRVTSSAKVPISGGDRADLPRSHAVAILNEARRQGDFAAKLVQFQALQTDQHCTDIHRMRSMAQMFDATDREELTAEMKRRLGENRSIKTASLADDIQCHFAEYQDLSPAFKEFLHDLRVKRGKGPAVQAIEEFYDREIDDLRGITEMTDSLNKIIEHLSGPHILSEGELYDLLFKYFKESTQLISSLITKSGEFLSKDVLARWQIGEALKNDHWCWVSRADREGMLYLNARLGVSNVDKGLTEQSRIGQRTAARIKKRLQESFTGIRADTSFCLANVDENTFVVTVDPISVKGISKEQALSLALSLGIPVPNDNPDISQIVNMCIEKIIGNSFEEMNREMSKIPEFKTGRFGDATAENAVDSHASGVFFQLNPSHFASPEQVLIFADVMSEIVKINRKAKIAHLIDDIRTELRIQAHYRRNERGDLVLYLPHQEGNEPISNEKLNHLMRSLKQTFSTTPAVVENSHIDTVKDGWIKTIDQPPVLINLNEYLRGINGPETFLEFIHHATANGHHISPRIKSPDHSIEDFVAALSRGEQTSFQYTRNTRHYATEESYQHIPMMTSGAIYFIDHLNQTQLTVLN